MTEPTQTDEEFEQEQARIEELRSRGDFAPKTDPSFVFPVPMDEEDLRLLGEFTD